jgi:EAL domain-containing protein (putative c-di-GMP-specific phosphodiesterase class I)
MNNHTSAPAHNQLRLRCQRIVPLGVRSGQHEAVTANASHVEVFAEVDGVSGEGWHHADRAFIRDATARVLSSLGMMNAVVAGTGSVSVNIDPAVVDASLDTAIADAVVHLDGRTLIIEVLETGPLSPAQCETLSNWQKTGIRVVVDDFGAGHADADRLSQLNWDGVKLDRELVARWWAGDEDAQVAVADVVANYAFVVAEGVEDPEVAAALAAAGVPYGQGWLWDRGAEVSAA